MNEKDLTIFEYRLGKEIKYVDIIKSERINGIFEKISYRTQDCGYIDGYIYRPSNYQNKKNLPVVFNFHGGGMVLGYCEQDGKYCQQIADLANVAVINVDYAVAPEFKFPLPITSTFEFINKVLANSKKYKLDSGKIILMGHSAGGYISASLCVLNAQKGRPININGLIADYAVLRQDKDPSERVAKDPDKAISIERMNQYINWYFEEQSDCSSLLASPIYAPSEYFPRSLIISAEFDSLCQEEKEFADKLISSGKDVRYRCFEGCMHGFTHDCFDEFDHIKSKEAWQIMADFIKEV